MFIGAKLAVAEGAVAPVVFFGLVVLNKSRILILHPHFFGPFGANVYISTFFQESVLKKKCASYSSFGAIHKRCHTLRREGDLPKVMSLHKPI